MLPPLRLVVPLLVAALAVAAGVLSSSAARPHAVTEVAGPAPRAPVEPQRVAPAEEVDSEIDRSSALPAGVHAGPLAPAPGSAPAARRRPRPRPKASADSGISPGAPSDEQVRRELHEMERVLRAARRRAGPSARAAVSARAEVPEGAPEAVARVIAGGNAIAKFPYVYGGGHGSFVDQAYDCSGSVSYALAAAGLLRAPLTSGALARWGAPGPGRWITIYANAGHTFMYVAGLRFDTSGRAGPLGSRWQTAPRSLAGFTVRHPPGL